MNKLKEMAKANLSFIAFFFVFIAILVLIGGAERLRFGLFGLLPGIFVLGLRAAKPAFFSQEGGKRARIATLVNLVIFMAIIIVLFFMFFLTEGAALESPVQKALPVIVILGFGLVACVSTVAFFKGRPPKEGVLSFDERDRLITFRAITVTYLLFWVFLFAGLFTLGIIMEDKVISAKVLTSLLAGIAIILFAVYSATILIQYGRGGKDGRE